MSAIDFLSVKGNRIINFWHVNLSLAYENLKSKFVGSRLGFFWSILNPIIFLLILLFVFTFFFPSGMDTQTRVLFIASGFIPWSLLSLSMEESGSILWRKADIVKRSAFDFFHFPIASVVSLFLLHVIFLVLAWVLLSSIPIFGLWRWIAFLIGTGSFLVFNFGVALLFSSLTSFFKDLTQLVPFFSQLSIWCSPIFWEPKNLPPGADLAIQCNPLYLFIQCYRDFLMGAESSSVAIHHALRTLPVSLVVFATGYFLFKRVRFLIPDQL